jgi:hypothetical protein
MCLPNDKQLSLPVITVVGFSQCKARRKIARMRYTFSYQQTHFSNQFKNNRAQQSAASELGDEIYFKPDTIWTFLSAVRSQERYQTRVSEYWRRCRVH